MELIKLIDLLRTRALAAVLTVSALFFAVLSHAETVAVGEVIFVAGNATLTRDASPMPVSKGSTVYPGDALSTDATGHVHIRFVDDGLISLRPGSSARIDQYRLDGENPDANRVHLTLDKGVLRSATGRIGQENKNVFRINTPIAAIGIRGTDFVIFADTSVARLAVNSGGVVMAPFGPTCQIEAVAPCSGDTSAELFANNPDALLEARGDLDYAMVTSDGASPDELVPPHPEESAFFDSLILNARSTLQSRQGLSAPGAESYEDGLERAERYLKQETLAQEAYALGALESSNILPRNRGLDSDPDIIWGRWSIYANDDPSYLSISRLLYDDRQYAVLNTVFAMLEEKNNQRLIPDSGRATFKLNSYESYVKRGSNLEQAGISNPALIIDFDDARFATRLDIHAASLPGVVHVLGAGDLTSDGFFHSDANSLSTIDGVLSQQALEAGFLFNYQISPGVDAVGATHWVNRSTLQ